MWRMGRDPLSEDSRASRESHVVAEGAGFKWRYLAVAAIGLGVAAVLMACGSPTIPSGHGVPEATYLIVVNNGPAAVILTIDLQPPVQAHVEVNQCQTIALNVPGNDSVEVVVTDSTTGTSMTFEVPFHEAEVWSVDGAPGSGGPRALGAIDQTSDQCQSQVS